MNFDNYVFGEKKMRIPKGTQDFREIPDEVLKRLAEESEKPEFLEITHEQKEVCTQLFPKELSDNHGKYSGSSVVRQYIELNTVDGEASVQLHVDVGIKQTYDTYYDVAIDTSYLDAFERAFLMDIDVDCPELYRDMVFSSCAPVVIKNEKTSDVDQMKLDNAVKSFIPIIKQESPIEREVVLLDPTPGTVSRLSTCKIEITLPFKKSEYVTDVVERADKYNLQIRDYDCAFGSHYYVGFNAFPRFVEKPPSFFGFEINPYSKTLRISGRMKFIVESPLRFSFDYMRKKHVLHHDWDKIPLSYYRYQTRFSSPFFLSCSHRSHHFNDLYVFYSTDPFLLRWEMGRCDDDEPPFPVDLQPYPSYDEEISHHFAYHGFYVTCKLRFFKGGLVDIDLPLCHASRSRLLAEVATILGLQVVVSPVNSYEHPVSGYIYDVLDTDHKLDHIGEVVLYDGNRETRNLARVSSFYSVRDRLFHDSSGHCFSVQGESFFAHKISSEGPSYRITKSYVPEAPSMLVKGKLCSFVPSLQNVAYEWSGLVRWHHSASFVRSPNYVFGYDSVKLIEDFHHVTVMSESDIEDVPVPLSKRRSCYVVGLLRGFFPSVEVDCLSDGSYRLMFTGFSFIVSISDEGLCITNDGLFLHQVFFDLVFDGDYLLDCLPVIRKLIT